MCLDTPQCFTFVKVFFDCVHADMLMQLLQVDPASLDLPTVCVAGWGKAGRW